MAYPFHLLSHCLYHCADKHEFNRHFSEYYACISKPLMRRIKRRLSIRGYRGDLNVATEDLWQKIFTEHYRSIFINLPESAERIQELAGSLTLTSRGEVFSRQVLDWERQVVGCASQAMAFFNHPDAENDAHRLEQQAREINDLRSTLRDQGYRLLTWLLPHTQAHIENESAEDDASSETDDDSGVANDDPMEDIGDNAAYSRYRTALKRRVAELNEIMCTEGETAADAAAGCEGGARFGVNTLEVLDQLSRILIPAMPMLYRLAGNRVTDYLRHVENDPIHNPLEQHANGDTDDDTEESLVNRIGGESKEPASSNFWKDMRTLLRQPVVAAWEALQQPGLTEKQRQRAQANLDRCKRYYDLNLDILWLKLEEEYSEEKIGSHLGLTRDQVRYREEKIRLLLQPYRDLMY